jgi:hypothetical protein
MVKKAKVVPIVADVQNCGHCRHFLKNKDDEAGYCRRYPPTSILDEDGIACVWPVTESSDACGEFTPRLNS